MAELYLILGTLVVGFIGSVLANRFDLQIANAIDRCSVPFKEWRLRRRQLAERQAEMLRINNANLIAYCASQTVFILMALIMLSVFGFLGIYASDKLRDLNHEVGSNLLTIALSCITSEKCRNDNTTRQFTMSFVYIATFVILPVVGYMAIYYLTKFIITLRGVTSLPHKDTT
jgi:hypothetical protein